jgi:hypothetical protein
VETLPLFFSLGDPRTLAAWSGIRRSALSRFQTPAASPDGTLLLFGAIGLSSPPIVAHLEKGGLCPDHDDLFKLLPDLDHALEWWEERVLAAGNRERNGEPLHVAEQLKDTWPAAVEPEFG